MAAFLAMVEWEFCSSSNSEESVLSKQAVVAFAWIQFANQGSGWTLPRLELHPVASNNSKMLQQQIHPTKNERIFTEQLDCMNFLAGN